MISSKILTCSMLAAIAMVASCSDGNDDVIMNRGYHLVYIHRLPECVTAWQNDYAPNTIDTTVADLRVSVTCSQMKGVDSPDISEGVIDGYKDIERQISAFLDPDNTNYVGSVAVPVEYRTKTCKDIRIGLYDKNGLFISDITENARFHYVIGPNSREEDAMNLLISSDRKLLGRIKLGTTIKEYLSYHPMIFAEAHFIFDGVEKGGFSNGNYAAIEIELGDGTILKANSVLRE